MKDNVLRWLDDNGNALNTVLVWGLIVGGVLASAWIGSHPSPNPPLPNYN